IVGLAVAFMWSGREPFGQRDMGSEMFRDLLGRTSRQADAQGQQLLSNIVVYPPINGAYNKPVYPVYFKELRVMNGKPVRVTRGINAEIPFVERDANPQNSILDYLRSTSARNAEVKWRFAVEREGKWPFVIGAVGGLILIGVVWPTILNLLVDGGLGGARTPKEKKVNLRSVRSGTSKKSVATTKGPSPKDEAALASYTERLASDVGTIEANSISDAKVAPPTAVRKLDAGPLEATSDSEKPKEEKAFDGEWYPVARPQGKPSDPK
ncbi:MAG TPA: hypothetical protein PK402_01395, partial [Tepidisphaeraceae bacterium]|nr:hypothetical protein [Tepidisphaeraceae bacterium]